MNPIKLKKQEVEQLICNLNRYTDELYEKMSQRRLNFLQQLNNKFSQKIIFNLFSAVDKITFFLKGGIPSPFNQGELNALNNSNVKTILNDSQPNLYNRIQSLIGNDKTKTKSKSPVFNHRAHLSYRLL